MTFQIGEYVQFNYQGLSGTGVVGRVSYGDVYLVYDVRDIKGELSGWYDNISSNRHCWQMPVSCMGKAITKKGNHYVRC